MNLEGLRPGAGVFSRDGHKLGSLSRFVLDRTAQRLTHIAVDTGILRSGEPLWKGGWGLSHDRLIPLGVVSSADDANVRLSMTAEEFRDLSVDYIAERFATIPDDEPGWPDWSDVRRIANSIPGEPGPYFMYEVMAKPAGAVDIKKDSPVWRMNPHEQIGEVDGLVVDDSGAVRAIVVRRGLFFKKDVDLPLDYVTEIVADIVRVEIDDDALNALPVHHAA